MCTQQVLSMAAPLELCYQQNSQLWPSAHPHSCLTLLRFQQLCPSHAGEVLRLDGQSGLCPAILAGYHPDWCQYQAVDQRAVLGSQGGKPPRAVQGHRAHLEQRACPAWLWVLCLQTSPGGQDARLAL